MLSQSRTPNEKVYKYKASQSSSLLLLHQSRKRLANVQNTSVWTAVRVDRRSVGVWQYVTGLAHQINPATSSILSACLKRRHHARYVTYCSKTISQVFFRMLTLPYALVPGSAFLNTMRAQQYRIENLMCCRKLFLTSRIYLESGKQQTD